ncbi:MAG TPA: hypothetical protein VF821_08990, partial [Lentzea sp.]
MIRRPRLEGLLRTTRLTTLVAPAGYGKTTLLTQAHTDRPVVWHTCQEGHRLLQPMASALAAGWTSVPAMSGEDEAGRAHAVAGLLIDAWPEDVTVVLDDIHVLRQGDSAVPLLEALCLQLPASARLVLSGRALPPFSLRRLKVDGELTEITASQLAFSAEETTVVAGHDVHEVTGGWPIAVRLVAETGTVEELADLVDEVVGREPEQTRSLLRAAAAFDRFTTDLLVELGHSGAATILPDLARRGLFVEHVRAEPGWFTLVPLAREYVEPAIGVHRTAAGWFASRGEYVRAVSSLAAL